MRAKQFSALGLLFALFLGARSANHNGQATPGDITPGRVGKVSPLRDARNLARTAKLAVALAENDCSGTENAEKLWWLSQESSPNCSPTLSPVLREICALYANGVPYDPAKDKQLSPEAREQRFLESCRGTSPSILFMMASVPNPRRTHLGLMTDRAIEAIQVAAAESDFLPLSHYLPWPSPASGPAEALVTEPESQSNSPEPGLLTFRRIDRNKKEDLANVDRDKADQVKGDQADAEQAKAGQAAPTPTYLLILLIPELPTEGLDLRISSRALKIVDRLAQDRQKTIPFEGPLFSGSVESLKELDNEIAGRKCLTAVSGSITNPGQSFEKNSCSKLEFTQTKDCDAISMFKVGAEAFWYKPEQIAILSEEGTQYGEQEGKKCDTRGLSFLHFPREISKLRNAYGAEAGKATSSTPADSSGQTTLGLQWQDLDAARRDEMQTYGGRQTPLSQETVLSSLSITLRARGIKALGILATDPLDEAFLIYSLKKSSPDIRLFVRDPDLLFLRTPDVASLNGTLLVSNYPLIPQNAFWSSSLSKSGGLITFPSAFQEGEYNAFIQLMEGEKLIKKEVERLEWNWPRGHSAKKLAPPPQPLWLATIGTAGHYPVTILNFDSKNPKPFADIEARAGLHRLDLGPPQYFPFTFWAFVAGLGVLHSLGVIFHKRVPAYFKRDFDIGDKGSVVTVVRLFCHLMATLTITLTQLILGSSYLFFYRSSISYSVLAGSVGTVTLFLLWMNCSQVRTLYVLRKQQEKLAVPDERNQIVSLKMIFWTGAVGAAIMVMAGAFWLGATGGARFQNAFLHFRDLNMSSGVAPNLPLAAVLMVLYFGVWTYLRRLSYWEHRYVEMCKLKLDQVIRQDLALDVKAIDTCSLGALENQRWMRALGLAFGTSLLAFRPWLTLDMIETTSVRFFLLGFLALALFALWMNWFRFINIWVHLRNILEHLENLPLRVAFQRLPREKSLPILHWSSSQNTFLLRQVLDRLRALARADASKQNIDLRNQFESRIEALMNYGVIETEMVEYRKVVGGSARSGLRAFTRSRTELVREARDEMTQVIDVLSARLLEQYWTRGSSSTSQNEKPEPPDLKYLLAEDIVALPFYAYIRKVMGELRNTLFFLGVAVSLLFAALHTYAFRADQAIDWWFFGLFAFMGSGIVFVIAQMERNALLSRLSDTTPGELGTGFYLQLLKYGAVPFLTIFGSQVPSISNLLLKWVQPALEALH